MRKIVRCYIGWGRQLAWGRGETAEAEWEGEDDTPHTGTESETN